LLYSGGATCYPASAQRKRHVQIRRCGPLMRSLCRAKEKHIKLLLTRLVVVRSGRLIDQPETAPIRAKRQPGDLPDTADARSGAGR
jgi:hypothetical protein